MATSDFRNPEPRISDPGEPVHLDASHLLPRETPDYPDQDVGGGEIDVENEG